VRSFRATSNAAYTFPLSLLVFGLINSCFESGMVVTTLVPFLLACCLAQLALFGETRRDHAATRNDTTQLI
jgi:hypothetical protein